MKNPLFLEIEASIDISKHKLVYKVPNPDTMSPSMKEKYEKAKRMCENDWIILTDI